MAQRSVTTCNTLRYEPIDALLTERVRLMFGRMDVRCMKLQPVYLRIPKLSLDVCWE